MIAALGQLYCNSATYPTSGSLIGPIKLTVDPHDSIEATLKMRIPPSAQLGDYVYNAFIGPHPSIEDEDHKAFTISN